MKSNRTQTSDIDFKHHQLFHKELICVFNECKRNITLVPYAFLQENRWFNKNICYKANTLFITVWYNSGYKIVKGRFNVNGFKSIEETKRRLLSQKNYLCEYILLKTVGFYFNVMSKVILIFKKPMSFKQI